MTSNHKKYVNFDAIAMLKQMAFQSTVFERSDCVKIQNMRHLEI